MTSDVYLGVELKWSNRSQTTASNNDNNNNNNNNNNDSNTDCNTTTKYSKNNYWAESLLQRKRFRLFLHTSL